MIFVDNEHCIDSLKPVYRFFCPICGFVKECKANQICPTSCPACHEGETIIYNNEGK